ncbi:MAG: restriction endonuclease subunit S [Rhodospirillales bacterium]|nr:restriction endonuclease subunit S [Rhodospirillales bacterium]
MGMDRHQGTGQSSFGRHTFDQDPGVLGGDVIWFAPSDLTGHKHKFIERGAKTITAKGLAKSSAKIMPAGGIMFSSRAPVGYVAIDSQPSATNQGFKSLIPCGDLFNEYLYYYLRAAKHVAEERATGTTFKELSGSAFGALPVPIAPRNEQARIVSKIEELFSSSPPAVEFRISWKILTGNFSRPTRPAPKCRKTGWSKPSPSFTLN